MSPHYFPQLSFKFDRRPIFLTKTPCSFTLKNKKNAYFFFLMFLCLLYFVFHVLTRMCDSFTHNQCHFFLILDISLYSMYLNPLISQTHSFWSQFSTKVLLSCCHCYFSFYRVFQVKEPIRNRWCAQMRWCREVINGSFCS